LLLLGHRGARQYAPENTVPAFELALQHGCDGIEFDVRLTSDGRAIICHDRYFAGLEVARNTFASLAALDPSLISLEDVIARFHSRAFLYVELKVPGLENATLDAFSRNPSERGYVVASFLPDVVRAMYQRDHSIPLGLICGRSHEFACWPDLPVDYVMPRHSLVSAALVGKLHNAGKRVIGWTVNSERDMRALANSGADGMMSDDTRLLCRTFCRSR
jgi:glycerophosphoryl diester phosphodiesterase